MIRICKENKGVCGGLLAYKAGSQCSRMSLRWLALGGASSCMYLTETTLAAAPKPLGQLQYYSYTHCVPAVFLVLISFKINGFSYPEYSHPLVPLCPITDILLYIVRVASRPEVFFFFQWAWTQLDAGGIKSSYSRTSIRTMGNEGVHKSEMSVTLKSSTSLKILCCSLQFS